MKKLLILAMVMLFALTGCGAGATDTMSCTYQTTSGAMTTKVTYNIDHQGDEIKKIRINYNYHQDDTNNDNDNNNGNMDGVGTGTDGTTNDNQPDNDGIVDGIVGSAIDSIISGVADTILDIAGIRDRHANVQGMYGNMNGFSVQNTNDTSDNNYNVSYVIDYDNISDNDLGTLNLSRDFNTLRNNYTSQGFTCR